MWFMEEVGELAAALRSGPKEELAAEFADVLAWLATLANIAEIDLDAAATVMSQLHTDAGDATLFTLLSAAVVPNAVAFSGSYLLGPGFAVGAHTLVSPTVVVLGPLPLFPAPPRGSEPLPAKGAAGSGFTVGTGRTTSGATIGVGSALLPSTPASSAAFSKSRGGGGGSVGKATSNIRVTARSSDAGGRLDVLNTSAPSAM